MLRLLIFSIFFIFATTEIADGASLGKLSTYQHELRLGRCTGDHLVDEDVVKTASPYTTKKLTYTWRGNNMYYITCINVYNKMDSSQGGSVRILEGGLGETETILEMISKNGKGMHFHLDLYGELRRN